MLACSVFLVAFLLLEALSLVSKADEATVLVMAQFVLAAHRFYWRLNAFSLQMLAVLGLVEWVPTTELQAVFQRVLLETILSFLLSFCLVSLVAL